MTTSIRYGSPTDLYLITEQIYQKNGLPSLANTIGPSLTQIYRVVLQVYKLHDTYIDGERVTDTRLSLWQLIKGSFGIGVTTCPTDENRLNLDYAGFTNIIQPLPEIGNLIPKVLTRQRTLPKYSPYIIGVDPLPSIKLYRNPRAVFLLPNGGKSVPIAITKYNRKTHEFVMLDTVSQIDLTIRELTTQIPTLRF